MFVRLNSINGVVDLNKAIAVTFRGTTGAHIQFEDRSYAVGGEEAEALSWLLTEDGMFAVAGMQVVDLLKVYKNRREASPTVGETKTPKRRGRKSKNGDGADERLEVPAEA